MNRYDFLAQPVLEFLTRADIKARIPKSTYTFLVSLCEEFEKQPVLMEDFRQALMDLRESEVPYRVRVGLKKCAWIFQMVANERLEDTEISPNRLPSKIQWLAKLPKKLRLRIMRDFSIRAKYDSEFISYMKDIDYVRSELSIADEINEVMKDVVLNSVLARVRRSEKREFLKYADDEVISGYTRTEREQIFSAFKCHTQFKHFDSIAAAAMDLQVKADELYIAGRELRKLGVLGELS